MLELGNSCDLDYRMININSDYQYFKKVFGQAVYKDAIYSIIEAFLGELAQDLDVLPISISHGLDFGASSLPMDIVNLNPYHWAYNLHIFNETSRHKKIPVDLPHPWALAIKLYQSQKRYSTHPILIIGPPPSINNDRRLLSALHNIGIFSANILVKPRGLSHVVENSLKFWRENGFNPIILERFSEFHFFKLLRLIDSHKVVYFPYLTSILPIAVLLQKECRAVLNYRFSAISLHPSYSSDSQNYAVELTKALKTMNQPTLLDLSSSLLGYYPELIDPVSVYERLHQVSNSFRSNPVAAYCPNLGIGPLNIKLSMAFANEQFSRYSLKHLISSKLTLRRLGIVQTCDFTGQSDGVSVNNYTLLPQRFSRLVKPGFGC